MSRRGLGRATLELVEAAKAELELIQPATVRAVCYRLFVSHAIPDMSKNSTQRVSRALVIAREQGWVPWSWIVDETRAPELASTWNNPEEIIAAAVSGYRRDYWQDQPERVEVWSEKGTVRGTLGPVLHDYGVTFRVMHGFGGATAVHDVAEQNSVERYERPLRVIYAGDWDPSGMYMSAADLPSRLERYGGRVQIERLAILREDHHLPGFPALDKKRDPRFRWFSERYGPRCWELDALPPPDLRTRVENAIRAHIDLDVWEAAVTVEAAETDSMREFLQAWNSRLRPDADCSESDR